MKAFARRWSLWREFVGRAPRRAREPQAPHPVPMFPVVTTEEAESEGYLAARPCGRVSCLPVTPRADGTAADPS